MITSLNKGGAEGQFFSLVNESSPSKAVVVNLSRNGYYSERLRDSGFLVVQRDACQGIFTFCVALIKLLRATKPDLMHCWMYHACFLGFLIRLLSGLKIPLIFNLRSSGPSFWGSKRSTLAIAYICGLLSWLPSVFVVSVSKNGLFNHKKNFLFDIRRSYVVTNSVKVAEQFGSSEILRRDTSCRSGKFRIGMVARWNPQKGHVILFKAIRFAKRALPDLDFEVVLVGSGVDTSNNTLVSLIEDFGLSDCVRLRGFVENLSDFYATSIDVLVLPSVFGEGVPNCVLEAQAHGIRCIVSDVGDSGLIVADKNAIFRPGDWKALSFLLMFERRFQF